MKLVKIKIKNFRCYKNETEISFNDLTAIIGRNDIGKSALLDAIDAFFNNKVDSGDLSTDTHERTVELTCCFEGLPHDVILDASVPSSAQDEGILNLEGQLEVKKVFAFGGRKTKTVYLIANHPTDERLKDLLSKKNTPLKSLADELGVNLDGVVRSKNPPIRKAIRDHIGGERAVSPIKVEGSLDNESNLKTIWKKLEKMLPIFSLFESDKPFDDKDGDIKDPLGSAISEALALDEIRLLLDQVEAKVREYSSDVADRTIEKLKDFDESLSEKLNSEFSKTPTYNKVFDLTLVNEKGIPLNKRGSGIRRLVVLSFFRAQAERRKQDAGAPSIIYAIEEPESSQHPNHQQMIIDTLCDLGQQENVQVIFTTHSSNLVREIPIDSLRFISQTEGNHTQIESASDIQGGTNNEEVIRKIIDTLGILPNPADRVKVLLFVEGNHDVSALKRYSNKLYQDDNGLIDLSDTPIVGYVITGGSSLKHYIEQRHLDGLGKPEIHIYDNDVLGYRDAVAAINNEENEKKIAFNTEKLELESYLHPDAIIEAYADNGIANLTLPNFDDQTDVPYVVAEQCYDASGNDWATLEDPKKSELASKKKKLLNTLAVEKMDIQRIKEQGGYDEMRMWLTQIRRLSEL